MWLLNESAFGLGDKDEGKIRREGNNREENNVSLCR